MAQPATKRTALWVIRRLRAAGHEALLAGGCVRDMLLGRRCFDYDVATDATPQQVRRLFGHVLLVGAKFGVAMVIHNRRKVEVSTFRSDLSYSDGRRPDGVAFTSARRDALRRDFTINGMFYDPVAGKVIDYVGGQRDLARRVVRTIGSPRRRFGEDYLRMLRAVRFAVHLEFSLEPATAAAVRDNAAKITGISGERIFEELSKMLARRSAAKAVELMGELGLARAILPELFAEEGAWQRAVARVAAVAARCDPVLTFGGLLGDLPTGAIGKIIRRWGAANDLRDALTWLARHLHDWPEAEALPLAEFKRLVAVEHFRRLRRLWAAEERRLTGRTAHARRIAARASAIPPEQVAPPPFVTGDDLIALGLCEGPELGRVHQRLYDAQLNEELTSRPAALRAARRMIADGDRHGRRGRGSRKARQ